MIGHVGKYQNHSDPVPKNMLHLEVFSCEDVKAFAELSKSRAASLPVNERTLLKIPKNSVLITHAQGMNATNPPKVTDAHNKVGYDFIIPVSVLEALPADNKIKASVVMGGVTTYTLWWRLDGLLSDANGNDINGWFAEPDIALSRHSPFEWEGFEFTLDTSSNVEHFVAKRCVQESLTEQECSKFSGSVTVPIDERLHTILDIDENKRISPAEIIGALRRLWKSQPISQRVINYESEWYFKPAKWDELDDLMGHTDSDSNVLWTEEKKRIEALSWWGELAGKYGIVESARVWHVHPVALISCFSGKPESQLITLDMLKKAKPTITDDYCNTILPFLNKYALLYNVDTPLRIAHLLAQVGHESGFKVREENLSYSSIRMRKIFGCRRNQAGYNDLTDECIVLPRLRPKLWSDTSRYERNAINLGSYVYANRNGNGDEDSQEGYKYRGRGIIQLTGKDNYRAYSRIHNQKDPADPKDFVEDPDLIIKYTKYGVESAFVWWDMNQMNKIIEDSYALRTETEIYQHVADVSIKVNGGTIGLDERVTIFNELRSMAEAGR